MSDVIRLNGDYGYDDYDNDSLAAGATVDASEAVFTVDNSSSDGTGQVNRYPFQIRDAEDLTITGGTVDGRIEQDTDWRDTYDEGNSAALRVENTPNVVIEDWRIDQPWDGIRISGNSPGFDIRDVHITNSRDDAVENDDVNGGTIRDSLFDGVFSGISLGDSGSGDGTDNVVTIDNVLLRNKSYDYKGEITHTAPIKMDKDDDVTPNLRITDSVFAIEDVEHMGEERLQKAWEKTIESDNNYLLNLSDDELPDDYPMPGKGWTVLNGQEARDYWEEAKSDWLSGNDGDADTAPAPAPEPPQDEIADEGGESATGTEPEAPETDGGDEPRADDDTAAPDEDADEDGAQDDAAAPDAEEPAPEEGTDVAEPAPEDDAAPALALDVDDIELRPFHLANMASAVSRDGAGDATRFEVRDTDGGDNFWLMARGGGRLDAEDGVELDKSELGRLWVQGDFGSSEQTLEIRTGDGETFGEWEEFSLVTSDWG